MPCYKPHLAAVVKSTTGGKSKVKFLKRSLPLADVAKHGVPTPLPCGQCIGCRLERSRQWAIRLMKELRLHDRACFITLTYDDAHLPLTSRGKPTLRKEDYTNFMKRLRFHFQPHRIRFFQCGEYGDKNGRPHHHAIIFGEDFCKDRIRVEDSRSGFPQYRSKTLTKLWGFTSQDENKWCLPGTPTLTDVAFENAAYVARYTLKKVTGSGSRFHYRGRIPEYITMSRNPGIASGYFDEFKDDMYPSDEIVPAIGRPASLPPKYFDTLLERVDADLYALVKKKRVEGLDYFTDPESTDSRLETRERVKASLIKNTLKREL